MNDRAKELIEKARRGDEGTPFGDMEGPAPGGFTQAKRRPYVKPDEGAAGMLADMQHVYRNADARHDKTDNQRKMREFMNGNLKGFLDQMSRLEKDRPALRGQAKNDDVETQRCLEHCERLLKVLAKEARGEIG